MIGSFLLASAMFAAPPAPPMMMGGCAVSKLWGTQMPAEIPLEQDRHVVQVQGKQIFWDGRLVTTDRVVAEVGPDMAQGSDMLVIDASTAKCAVVTTLAAALEGPSACTPARCFLSMKPVSPRKKPDAPEAEKPAG